MSTSYLETVRAAWTTELEAIRYATSTGSDFYYTTHEIKRTTGSFLLDGWKVGMTGTITNSITANNNATFTVTGTVTALVLTVTETLTAVAVESKGAATLTSYPYRNTVHEVYQSYKDAYPKFPCIVFFFGEIDVQAKADDWQLFDFYVPFFICCQINAATQTGAESNLVAQQDSLFQDIMRVVLSLTTKNINATSGPKWNVQVNPHIHMSPLFPADDNTAEFVIAGQLHIRNMDRSMDD